MRKSAKILNILIGVCGVIALWLVIDNIIGYKYQEAFYINNPNIELYIGTNVVSRWAALSYFTYITIIIFGVWCLLYTIANLFNIAKLKEFVCSNNLVGFVYANYIVTFVLYNIFELFLGSRTFGWYGDYPLSWHNLFVNIINHYILFIFATIIYIKVGTISSTKGKVYNYCISIFLLAYYVVVKILGEFAYNIRWFPYVIFDATSFGKMLGINSYALSIVLLTITCGIIFFLYFVLYHFLVKHKEIT